MGIIKKTRKILGHVIDLKVDRWVDLDYLKHSTKYYWRQAKFIFSSQKPTHEESFDEAVERMDLTPETLNKQVSHFGFIVVFFMFLAVSLFSYSLYMVWHKNWMGAGLAIALMFYALSLAFHFHFWRFQIANQKLGCSLREWFMAFFQFKRTQAR